VVPHLKFREEKQVLQNVTFMACERMKYDVFLCGLHKTDFRQLLHIILYIILCTKHMQKNKMGLEQNKISYF
jgi:hypothetical protein